MLRDLQRHFAAAVFEENPAVVAQVLPGRFPAAQHVQIYRNNITNTLSVALAAVYPVVEKLVSPGFFGYAAHEYLRDHRPMSANLHDFGGAFAEFLASFIPAAGLPYLADVARLEWAWHRAFHAAEAPSFDPAALAKVPADRLSALRLGLHPSANLLISPYPVIRIFEINQEEYSGDASVDLDAGGENALVIRRGLNVFVEPLTNGAVALLLAVHQNQTLAQALDVALTAEAGFDLNTVLADHVRRGTIARIYTN